jgi:hypothetical protein
MTNAATPVLTPNEIATNLMDAGYLDRATAMILEQRIVAFVDNRIQEVRLEVRLTTLAEAVDKAELAVKRTKGERQKAVAQRVLAAIKNLLPSEEATRHDLAKAEKLGYYRGFRDGKKSSD